MNLFDKLNMLNKQSFSAAAIVDAQGNSAGRVIIRFTDSQIGWNHEVGVIFSDAGLNLAHTSKGNTYSTPGTLYFMLREAGVKSYTWNGKQIGDYDNKTGQNYDSLGRFDDIAKLKIGRKHYNLLWII